MPFAYGAIEIEKLPFHSCTLTCLLCFLSRHSKSLRPYKKSFALIGFISNISYVVVPAGVMWSEVTPLSYRCLQTILFHGVTTLYGILALIYDDEIKLEWKKIYQELIVLCIMGLWATLGNNLYSGTYPTHTIVYNWFFMRTDPFGILPQTVAPFVTIGFFFVCCAIIHAIYYGIKKLNKNKKCTLKGPLLFLLITVEMVFFNPSWIVLKCIVYVASALDCTTKSLNIAHVLPHGVE
jgi:hypothetical protein